MVFWFVNFGMKKQGNRIAVRWFFALVTCGWPYWAEAKTPDPEPSQEIREKARPSRRCWESLTAEVRQIFEDLLLFLFRRGISNMIILIQESKCIERWMKMGMPWQANIYIYTYIYASTKLCCDQVCMVVLVRQPVNYVCIFFGVACTVIQLGDWEMITCGFGKLISWWCYILLMVQKSSYRTSWGWYFIPL